MAYRNIAENFNRLSRVHERYRQTADGWTTTYKGERDYVSSRSLKMMHKQFSALEVTRVNAKSICREYSPACTHQRQCETILIPEI